MQFEIDRTLNHHTGGLYGDDRGWIAWPSPEMIHAFSLVLVALFRSRCRQALRRNLPKHVEIHRKSP
jgi:hypothetical protein